MKKDVNFDKTFSSSSKSLVKNKSHDFKQTQQVHSHSLSKERFTVDSIVDEESIERSESSEEQQAGFEQNQSNEVINITFEDQNETKKKQKRESRKMITQDQSKQIPSEALNIKKRLNRIMTTQVAKKKQMQQLRTQIIQGARHTATLHDIRKSTSLLVMKDFKAAGVKENIDEKQLCKLKSKIQFECTYQQYQQKFANSPLKPGVLFFKCFERLMEPKFETEAGKAKKKFLLAQLLQHQVLIPDTLISYRENEVSTRVRLDRDKVEYVITQGEHLTSYFYSGHLKTLLKQLGLTSEIGTAAAIQKLGQRPIAVEKLLRLRSKPLTQILIQETLKHKVHQQQTDWEIVQEYIRSRNKEGKVNFYRVIYDNQKIDQSRRRPMMVYNVVQRNPFPKDEEMERSKPEPIRFKPGGGFMKAKDFLNRTSNKKDERNFRSQPPPSNKSPSNQMIRQQSIANQFMRLASSSKLMESLTPNNVSLKQRQSFRIQARSTMAIRKLASDSPNKDLNALGLNVLGIRNWKQSAEINFMATNNLRSSRNFHNLSREDSNPASPGRLFQSGTHGVSQHSGSAGSTSTHCQFKNAFCSDLNEKYLASLSEFEKTDVFQQNIQVIGGQHIETMLQGIIKFIEQLFPEIKIKQIVCDFILDINGQAWLTDVQHFKTIRVVRLSQTDPAKLKLFKTLRNKVERCFMCKKYKMADEYVVGMYEKRQLIETKISLCRRGLNQFFIKTSTATSQQEMKQLKAKNLTLDSELRIQDYCEYFNQLKYLQSLLNTCNAADTTRVCHGCKAVIDIEQKLMSIQTEYQRALSLKSDFQLNLMKKNRPKFYQYRLCFFITTLYFQPSTIFKVQQLVQSKKQENQLIYLHFAIKHPSQSDLIFLTPTGIPISVNTINSNLIPLNKVVVRYFWMDKDKDKHVQKFYQDAELNVFITEWQGQNRPNEHPNIIEIASGYAFQSFIGREENKMSQQIDADDEDNVQIKQHRFYFFNQEELLDLPKAPKNEMNFKYGPKIGLQKMNSMVLDNRRKQFEDGNNKFTGLDNLVPILLDQRRIQPKVSDQGLVSQKTINTHPAFNTAANSSRFSKTVARDITMEETHVHNDFVDFTVSLQALPPSHLPNFDSLVPPIEAQYDTTSCPSGFTIVNSLVMFPITKYMDFLDTLQPFPISWIDIIDKIIEEAPANSTKELERVKQVSKQLMDQLAKSKEMKVLYDNRNQCIKKDKVISQMKRSWTQQTSININLNPANYISTQDLDEQLKRLDFRTTELVKVDTSLAVPRSKSMFNSQIKGLAMKQALTHSNSTHKIAKRKTIELIQNAKRRLQNTDVKCKQRSKSEQILDQKKEIVDSIQFNNRQKMESVSGKNQRIDAIYKAYNTQVNVEKAVSKLTKFSKTFQHRRSEAPGLDSKIDQIKEDLKKKLEGEEDNFEDIIDHTRVFQMVCSKAPPVHESKIAKERYELTSSYSSSFHQLSSRRQKESKMNLPKIIEDQEFKNPQPTIIDQEKLKKKQWRIQSAKPPINPIRPAPQKPDQTQTTWQLLSKNKNNDLQTQFRMRPLSSIQTRSQVSDPTMERSKSAAISSQLNHINFYKTFSIEPTWDNKNVKIKQLDATKSTTFLEHSQMLKQRPLSHISSQNTKEYIAWKESDVLTGEPKPKKKRKHKISVAKKQERELNKLKKVAIQCTNAELRFLKNQSKLVNLKKRGKSQNFRKVDNYPDQIIMAHQQILQQLNNNQTQILSTSLSEAAEKPGHRARLFSASQSLISFGTSPLNSNRVLNQSQPLNLPRPYPLHGKPSIMTPIYEVKDSSRSMFDLKPPLRQSESGLLKQGITREFKELVVKTNTVKHKQQLKVYAA